MSLRRIIKVGNSRAVTIPDEWFHFQRGKRGSEPEEVEVDATGDTIHITPVEAREVAKTEKAG